MPLVVDANATEPLTAAKIIAADIKLGHSVFALPFAILGAVMAAAPPGSSLDWGRFLGQLTLIVLAMFFARTVAMLSNRLLDADLDRHNPRTASRAIPSGRLTPRVGLIVLIACAMCFVVACIAFGGLYDNWWPARLSIPVLLWISAYPLLKRFTSLCHLYLGSSLALSPLAAALAIDPHALLTQPSLWLLSGMVLTWVAGFDIIYALQDIETDRRQGIYSIPGRLGVTRALQISRGLHALSALALIAILWIDSRLGLLAGIGVTAVIALLIYEHATVTRWGTQRLALAFFAINGVISCVLVLWVFWICSSDNPFTLPR